MTTLADAKLAFFKAALGHSGSISDLEKEYYAGLSGLTPASKFSLSDHKKTARAAQAGITVTEKETDYYRTHNAVGPSFSDVAYDYYT